MPTTYGVFVVFSVLHLISAEVSYVLQPQCDDDRALSNKLQSALSLCQNDLESIIMHGVFRGLIDELKSNPEDLLKRNKRETASPGKQVIAGCMLLCMFRKLNVIDEDDIPTVEGLVKHLGDEIQHPAYFLAMSQAAQLCVTNGRQEKISTSDPSGKCRISYKIFDCLLSEMTRYCREG